MSSFTFNDGKVKLANGSLNYEADSGPTGTLRVMLVIHDPTVNAGAGEPDLNKDYTNLGSGAGGIFSGANTYEEYDGAGYPGPSAPPNTIADRPRLPVMTVVADYGQDEAEINPSGATQPEREVDFGSPLAAGAGKVIRALIVYEHVSDVNDDLNVPIAFIDQGTLVGQNGNGQPMTVSWSGIFAALKDA